MPMQRHKPEQIVTVLRQIEVAMAKGKSTPQACKDAGIHKLHFSRESRQGNTRISGAHPPPPLLISLANSNVGTSIMSSSSGRSAPLVVGLFLCGSCLGAWEDSEPRFANGDRTGDHAKEVVINYNIIN